MEEKIMNILEQLYIEVKGIKGEMETTNKRLDSLEGEIKDMKGDIKDLKTGQDRTEERLTRIESKVDSIENKLDNIELQNADRHIAIQGEIKGIRKDLTTVEIITSSNWNDIAKLKAVK